MRNTLNLRVFRYRLSYVLIAVSVALMNSLAMLQSSMLQVARPPSGYVLPTLIGFVVGLFMSSSRVNFIEKGEAQKRMFLTIVHSLSVALDERDSYTYGHSSRVTELAMALGRRVGLPPEQLEVLEIGSILHDIGKIGVPDSLLLKPGTLTSEELALLRQHTVKGERIIGDHSDPTLDLLIRCIRSHHERFDGTGYPDRLAGEQIPVLARIIAIADAYDAMTSLRPYRGKLSHEQAMEEIRRCSGSQFDPRLAGVFEALAADFSASGLEAFAPEEHAAPLRA